MRSFFWNFFGKFLENFVRYCGDAYDFLEKFPGKFDFLENLYFLENLTSVIVGGRDPILPFPPLRISLNHHAPPS